MSDDRPIDCLHGYRKWSKCTKHGCRQNIVWVLDIGGPKAVNRPFTPASQPFETFERENGVKVDRYGPEAFHRCPPKKSR